MKLIPLAFILASAIFCSSIRTKIEPTSTPLSTLEATPQPSGDTSLAMSPQTEQPKTQRFGGAISGGILNGKAKSLPKPDYPAAAKAVKASGEVMVQVLVDEKGSVVSATAVSGHPLLRKAATEAAKKTVFEPTILSGTAVKVAGALTFSFDQN